MRLLCRRSGTAVLEPWKWDNIWRCRAAGTSAVEKKKDLGVSAEIRSGWTFTGHITSSWWWGEAVAAGVRHSQVPPWALAARGGQGIWQVSFGVLVCGKSLQESKLSSGTSTGHCSHWVYPTWLICLGLSIKSQSDRAMEMDVNEVWGLVCWGVTSREIPMPL